MHSVTSNAVAEVRDYFQSKIGKSFNNQSISTSINTWHNIFNFGVLTEGQYKVEWSGSGFAVVAVQSSTSYLTSTYVPTGIGIINIPAGGSDNNVNFAIYSQTTSCSCTVIITKL